MVLILDGNSEKGAHVMEQYLLFDLDKGFDYIKSSHKFVFLSEKTYFVSYARTMFWVTIQYKYPGEYNVNVRIIMRPIN